MKPTINNHTDRDLSKLTKTFNSFEEYARKKLNYDKPFTLNFRSDSENAGDMFGKTAYYDPTNMDITIFVDDRHNKDMLRSISHEMVHHTQNCRGDFDNIHELGEGYAQKDPHLRSMEAEAYLIGNGFLVRDFEDACKLGDIVLMEWKKDKRKQILKEGARAAGINAIESLWSQIFDANEEAALAMVHEKLEGQSNRVKANFAIQLLQKFGFTPEEIMSVKSTLSSLISKQGAEAAKTPQQATATPQQTVQQAKPAAKQGVAEHYRKRNQLISEQVFEKLLRRK